MTETVTAPTADAGEATAEATEAKAPVSTKEKITKALGRSMPPLHEAFIKWVKAEADVDLDPTSVLATQSLYKHQADQKRRQAAEQRANERAEKIKALLADMQGGDSAGDEPADESAPAETDEDVQEAF